MAMRICRGARVEQTTVTVVKRGSHRNVEKDEQSWRAKLNRVQGVGTSILK